MENDLPDEFDLIVVGTGFAESCVAAAASRIGKTVLHIDPNDYYGGSWASFNLQGFIGRLDRVGGTELRNSGYTWHIPAEPEIEPVTEEATGAEAEVTETMPVTAASLPPINTKSTWTQEQVLELSRRFSLDLTPRLLYCAGKLVQLLISSNICRYGEFRSVDHVCTTFHSEIVNVPCSRSDVFNSRDLSIVEKRLLMKFLSACTVFGEEKYDEDMALYRDLTFREYLQQQQVTEKIKTCIMQAIAMCTDETPFEQGMAATKHFLGSLGRYGNTPFLFPMYGCGELPQCFCRLSAVFGGIYCLKRRIESITVDADTNLATVRLEGQPVRAKHVVTSHGNVPSDLCDSQLRIRGAGALVNGLSRGVFIAASPLGNAELNTGGGGVNVLRLVFGLREAFVMQLSHYSGTCPRGTFIFHITTLALTDHPEADLEPFVTQVFKDQAHAPQLLFSAYFTLTRREYTGSTGQPIDALTPIFCTEAPVYELDYDRCIDNATEIFRYMFGDVTFLPRAPDPDEIVIDGEDPRALSENSLPEDLREQLRQLEEATQSMEIGTDIGQMQAE